MKRSVARLVGVLALVCWAGLAWSEEARDADLDARPGVAGSTDAGGHAGDGGDPGAGGDGASTMRAMMGGGEGTTRAMAGHILVEATERSVRISEVYVLAFGPDAARGRSDELWLPLPEEATSLTVDRGEELVRVVDDGLALNEAVEPGRQALAFSFVMPAEHGRAVVAHELPFSVGALHVMWPASAPFSARAMGFEDRGVIEMGPRRMRILERASFPAAERLVIATSDRPSPPPEMAAPEPETVDPLGVTPWATLLVAILALLTSTIVPLRRRSNTKS